MILLLMVILIGNLSSAQVEGNENTKDYEFTDRFYIVLILGAVVVILIVLWVILLKRNVK